MIVCVAAVVAVAVLAGVLWTWERQRSERALKGRMRVRVIVTTKTGESFSGVMFERDALLLVLRDAVHLQPNAQVPVDGELLVPWTEVAYVQSP